MKNHLRQLARDLHLPAPPFALIATALILVPLTWLPLAFIARSNVTLSSKRPIHMFLDMDNQPRYDAQDVNPIFADQRAMRQNPPGTVPYGTPRNSSHFLLGYYIDDEGNPITDPDPTNPQMQLTRYYRGFPDRVRVDDRLLRRGQQRFNIYCYPCHGKGGYGDGPVNQRALQLMELDLSNATWTTASDMHAVVNGEQTFGEKLYPEGKLYNTITNGIRNMPGYGAQIPPEDRWAIVAYVRTLQLSRRAQASDVPENDRNRILAPLPRKSTNTGSN